jgi:hypothetical protein
MKLANLAHVLRAAGITVVETAGWATRGYDGQDLTETAGVLWHHTATPRERYAMDSAPTLGLCIGGRPDLAGPLCNIVLGRNGVAYLVAAGVANHAGAGSAPGIPDDLGNHYLIGIEMESSGVAPWDWTAAQLAAAPRLGAALERHYLNHLPPEMRLQLGHLEYSSQGKIDPAGWPGGMDGLRVAINTELNNEGTTTVALNDEDLNRIFGKKFDRKGGMTGEATLGGVVAYIDSNMGRIINAQASHNAQVKALVGAVAALSKGEAFDEAKLLAGVEEAAAAGVSAALDSLKVTVEVPGNE